MDAESLDFDAWATKILDLSRQINAIFPGGSGGDNRGMFYKQGVAFKYLVNAIAGCVEMCWMDKDFEEATQSQFAKRVGKELLVVLKRGLQLLKQLATQGFTFMVFGSSIEIIDDVKKDFANWLLMMFGSTGEFCEIIDDVKMYCQMMNKLIAGSIKCDATKNTQDHIHVFQNDLDSACKIVQRQILKNNDQIELLFGTGYVSSIFQMSERPVEQRNNIAESEVSLPAVLGKRTIGIIRKALWCQRTSTPVFGHLEIDGGRKALLMDMDLTPLEKDVKKDEINLVAPFILCKSPDIILQIARGIKYLHEVSVLVKSREDGQMTVKIAGNEHTDELVSLCQTCAEMMDFPEPLKSSIRCCLGIEEILHHMWELKEILIKYTEEDDVHEMIRKVLESKRNGEISESDLSLKEILGRGSYGTVRKALWHEKEVAVKEFDYDDQFEEEYEVFMQLKTTDCSHIVQLFGHSKLTEGDAHKKAIVMELMDTDLESLIVERKKDLEDPPFSLDESVDFMLRLPKD